MEYIKRKILREDIISREPFTYGQVVEGHIHLNVPLYQKFNNLGHFTDIEYVNEDVDYSPLIEKLESSGITFEFFTASTATVDVDGYDKHIRVSGRTLDDYFYRPDFLSGVTSSKKNEVRSYDKDNPFIEDLALNEEPYVDLSGNTGTSINKVIFHTSGNTGTTKYTIAAFSGSPYIGTTEQTRGVQYQDFPDGVTTFGYTPEGYTDANFSLSALTKQEYLLGISERPKVNSDVFIDRGVVSPLESHLRLSEIKTLNDLENYNNGFYNIIKI